MRKQRLDWRCFNYIWMLILTADKIEPQLSETSSPTSASAPAPTLVLSTPGMSGDHRPVIKYPSEYVKLNVGGSLHYTTISTLRKYETMLRAMFSGRMDVQTDSEGIFNMALNE